MRSSTALNPLGVQGCNTEWDTSIHISVAHTHTLTQFERDQRLSSHTEHSKQQTSLFKRLIVSRVAGQGCEKNTSLAWPSSSPPHTAMFTCFLTVSCEYGDTLIWGSPSPNLCRNPRAHIYIDVRPPRLCIYGKYGDPFVDLGTPTHSKISRW